MKKIILVTGAGGFVGQTLCTELRRCGWCVRGTLRRLLPTHSANEQIIVDNIDGYSDWAVALQNVEVVIHLAARVHLVNDTSTAPLDEFRRVNVQGTENLAKQSALAGVKRLVYISSIKVNGEGTYGLQHYSERDTPAPQDAYGVSKWEAEQALLRVAQETDLEVVIIRPVLVYGPGVKANFLSMMRWLYIGVPLPLAALQNKRSLVGLDNLVDLIVTCIKHPAAANQTFLVSDGEDLSTPELLRRLAQALGKPARLLPVPSALLQIGATLLGRQDITRRLCGSLQVDIGKTLESLDWSPPISVDEGLRRTAEAFLRSRC